MKPKTIEQMQQSSIDSSQMDDTLHLIQDAVTLGYVATDSDEAGRMRLERLLVTLLAALVRNPEAPASSQARAEYLADLLIGSVREADRACGLD